VAGTSAIFRGLIHVGLSSEGHQTKRDDENDSHKIRHKFFKRLRHIGFGSLEFTIVPSVSAISLNPEANEPSPILPNGEPQFETRLFGIRIINRQFGLYSQHRNAAKQAAWRNRVISGLHSWFEQPSPPDRSNR
jgi:hypothetical protein